MTTPIECTCASCIACNDPEYARRYSRDTCPNGCALHSGRADGRVRDVCVPMAPDAPRTVCLDCGAMSADPCAHDEATCSACSVAVDATGTPCAAHPYYPPTE